MKMTPQGRTGSHGGQSKYISSELYHGKESMNIFDSLKKSFEKEENIEKTSRDLAKSAVVSLLNGIRKSQKEESLQLIRRPSDGSEGINIELQYHGAGITAPIYAYFAVKRLADIADISFETMISLMETFDELMPEVIRMEEHRKNEDTADED